MLLSEVNNLNLQTKTLNALANKHINTVREMLLNLPRHYFDYRQDVSLEEAYRSAKNAAVKIVIEKVKKTKSKTKVTVITCRGYCSKGKGSLSVTWIGCSFMESILNSYQENREEVIVCGKVKYDPTYGYTMQNPDGIVPTEHFKYQIKPVYSKYKGLSDDMRERILEFLLSYHTEEIMPAELVSRHNLPTYREMMYGLHRPDDIGSYKKAKMRLVYEDMLYFAAMLHESDKKTDNITNCAMHRSEKMQQVIKSLPYQLTESQQSAVREMIAAINSGKRLNALLNGDVGAGKSIVMFLMMVTAAENGYQAVLMAPTVILAKQHYEELKGYAEICDLPIAFLSTETKGKALQKTLREIADGTVKLIVGTHAVISNKVEYKNVALVITDEEHRFGTEQRNRLEQKAVKDCNVISATATPIPRTLASVMYQNKSVFYLKPPKEKGQIQTAVTKNINAALAFAKKQIEEGRQCYAVCPLIEAGEETNNVSSVEDTLKIYEKYFAGTDIKIESVTGKTKKEDAARIIEEYRQGRIDILIATTIIEVGVSVKNASVMIIHNAERFGLFQLHQLRGRIGRGQYKGYCILLNGSDSSVERLNVLARETDGFKISEADLAERGSGDLIGTEQSGFNKYVELMVKHGSIFEEAKRDVLWCENNGISLEMFIEEHQ